MDSATIIAGAARQEARGRARAAFQRKMADAREGSMGHGISQDFFISDHVSLYIVSIDDTPISRDDFRRLDPRIRGTHGRYSLQYIPAGSPRRNPRFPYLIGQDLVRIRVTVSGPRHWGALCKRIPELDWVRRNSTMTDAMFAIAKKHPGLVLRFGIDFPKYCGKIESAAERLGIDIDHKPLVTYQWGANPPEPDREAEPVRQRTKADYLKEIELAASESAGEEEI